MNFKPYSKTNQAYKLAAPTPRDAKPRQAMFKSTTLAPRNGCDYVYGYAHIKAAKKLKETPVNEFAVNPMGWLLPGGAWTNNNARVMDAAKEIDRLIRAGGGLPKGCMNKEQVAA
jgi:hypothetical protein